MKRGLVWAVFVAVIGSLLFGINMAAIAGAVVVIKEVFGLKEFELGLVVSSIIVGCMVGAFSVGSLSEQFGRKKIFISTAFLFMISAIGSALCQSIGQLIAFRLVGGVAVGAISVVVPTYISEMAPPNIRGVLGTFNQLGVVIGVLLAYTVDYFVADIQNGWRWMLLCPLFFAVPFLLFLLLNFPESPRWLILKGRISDAEDVLKRVMAEGLVKQEMAAIRNSVLEQGTINGGVGSQRLIKGKLRKVVFLGVTLAAFQQITGINAIISYAPSIFEKAGVGGSTALLQSIFLGVINLGATLVAVWLIEKAGRKLLLLYGALGMVVTLTYISYSFYVDAFTGTGVFIAILGYVAFFAASLAPIMWVVTSEIYPNKIRGVAMSISTAVSWICAFFVVQFFPWLLDVLGGAFSFGLFALFSLWAFFFILLKIPETKGKSLEQIEKDLGLTNS